jgi:hypothetical protein
MIVKFKLSCYEAVITVIIEHERDGSGSIKIMRHRCLQRIHTVETVLREPKAPGAASFLLRKPEPHQKVYIFELCAKCLEPAQLFLPNPEPLKRLK